MFAARQGGVKRRERSAARAKGGASVKNRGKYRRTGVFQIQKTRNACAVHIRLVFFPVAIRPVFASSNRPLWIRNGYSIATARDISRTISGRKPLSRLRERAG